MSMRIVERAAGQRGVSLIELMIAMVLGLLVLGAVIQLFIGSKATYTSNEALARVQENGRFSIELLKQEVRDIGAQGFCAARLEIRNHLDTDCPNHPGDIFGSDLAFMGWEFDGTGRAEAYTLPEDLSPDEIARSKWSTQLPDGSTDSLPSWLEGLVVPGSDVVVLRQPEIVPGITADPGSNNSSTANSITLTGSHGLEPNEIVLVSNCTTGADLFQNVQGGGGGGGGNGGGSGNSSALTRGGGSCSNPGPGNVNLGSWSTVYDDTMQLFRLRVDAYFVGLNDDTGEPGLYRHDFSRQQTEELVSGVENMQILYGYSNPSDEGGDGQTVNHWLPAHQVPNWEFVIGARLSLLVRSPENMGDGTVQRTFDLASTAVTHQEDGRLRQPFFTAVSLRNRQIVM
ncbi:PilW family protein [Wenzhouxiangella sp. EGI_FJ10409]|uniref:PilW family protein n=1 Tax=Wenzhouxiangella sp. EGI_FJ10409 TaxID=3243767 RepID=UPI0035D738EA